MSIEQTLERIAAGIETLIQLQGVANQPVTSPAPAPGPSGTGPGQLPPQVHPMSGPVPGPASVQAAPASLPPMAPPQIQQPPVQQPPQVAATGLLDQIRDAANAYNRAHPELAGQVWSIITRCGGDTNGGLASIPAQNHVAALQQIQALGA